MATLRPFSGFPAKARGGTRFQGGDILLRDGDWVVNETKDDVVVVQGVHALAQALELEIHQATDPRSTQLDDVPISIAATVLEGSVSEYLESVFAVRSDGFIVEVEFSAVGYPDTYIQRLRLASAAGQFPLQVVSRDHLLSVAAFEDALLAHLHREPDLLRQVHPRRFEEIIARVVERMGFEVELTRYSKDDGVDIFALRRDGGVPVLLVIDCKRYARNRPIGPGMVRMLYGLREQHHANTAMAATTSYITKGAADLRMQFGEDKIELADFDRIQGWLGAVGWTQGPHGILVPAAVPDPPKLWVPP